MNHSACKRCGHNEFKDGMLGSGHANVKGIDKNLSIGSGVLITFCAKCGEITSLRVKNPEKVK
jgi:ribosomal protein L40E